MLRSTLSGCILSLLVFFFQAEDGIRDRDVTGVQTCAFRSAERATRCQQMRLSQDLVEGPWTHARRQRRELGGRLARVVEQVRLGAHFRRLTPRQSTLADGPGAGGVWHTGDAVPAP